MTPARTQTTGSKFAARANARPQPKRRAADAARASSRARSARSRGNGCSRRTAHPRRPPTTRRSHACGSIRRKVGRDLGGIGERLVEPVCEMWNDVKRVSGLDIKFRMVGAEMSGDLLRTLGFIIAAFVKADGEGLHR